MRSEEFPVLALKVHHIVARIGEKDDFIDSMIMVGYLVYGTSSLMVTCKCCPHKSVNDGQMQWETEPMLLSMCQSDLINELVDCLVVIRYEGLSEKESSIFANEFFIRGGFLLTE